MRRENDDFVPNFANINFERVLNDRLHHTGLLTAERHPRLIGINLSQAFLQGADLSKAKLNHANLSFTQLWGCKFFGADLRNANFRGANSKIPDIDAPQIDLNDLQGQQTFGADLGGAKFANADLARADFTNADMTGADFRRVYLRKASLNATNFDGASPLMDADVTGCDIRTIFTSGAALGDGFKRITRLPLTLGLTQNQLDTMIGDRGVVIPEDLSYPDHWLEPEPPVPDKSLPKDIVEQDGRIFLRNVAPPTRADLETIHSDLREDVTLLNASGSLNNISMSFDSAFQRFASVVCYEFNRLDQIRLGVQTNTLRLRLDALRKDIAEIAPEKLGDIDAVLLAAELLTSRLPEWIAFLNENRPDQDIVEENAIEIADAITEISEAMQSDPEHYDPALPERLAEYLDTKTTDAYWACISLIDNAAFVTFQSVRNFLRDSMNQTRKTAINGLARSVCTVLGSALAKLAGLVPTELEWILPWLKFIPTVLG